MYRSSSEIPRAKSFECSARNLRTSDRRSSAFICQAFLLTSGVPALTVVARRPNSSARCPSTRSAALTVPNSTNRNDLVGTATTIDLAIVAGFAESSHGPRSRDEPDRPDAFDLPDLAQYLPQDAVGAPGDEDLHALALLEVEMQHHLDFLVPVLQHRELPPRPELVVDHRDDHLVLPARAVPLGLVDECPHHLLDGIRPGPEPLGGRDLVEPLQQLLWQRHADDRH